MTNTKEKSFLKPFSDNFHYILDCKYFRGSHLKFFRIPECVGHGLTGQQTTGSINVKSQFAHIAKADKRKWPFAYLI